MEGGGLVSYYLQSLFGQIILEMLKLFFLSGMTENIFFLESSIIALGENPGHVSRNEEVFTSYLCSQSRKWPIHHTETLSVVHTYDVHIQYANRQIVLM